MADKPFTNEGGGRYSGFFGSCACPQHGGRTATSTTHAGNDGVSPGRFHLVRESRDNLVFIAAMGRAEDVVIDELNLRIALFQAFFQERKNLIAPEQIVPDETDGLALQRVQTIGEWRDLLRFLAARPDHRISGRLVPQHGRSPSQK